MKGFHNEISDDQMRVIDLDKALNMVVSSIRIPLNGKRQRYGCFRGPIADWSHYIIIFILVIIFQKNTWTALGSQERP